MGKTLYEKLWEAHVVRAVADEPTLLYIDLHLIHEVTSPQAFAGLAKRNLPVRRPDLTIGTIDHAVPTKSIQGTWSDTLARKQVDTLITNCQQHGIQLYGLDSQQRGIVHVIGPELGYTQPGKTIVCGDSHTSTHGAFGALAFGIGTSEVEHVLATQCLMQTKTKTMAITVHGTLAPGVSAKDIILRVIHDIGIGGGTGYTIEYRGSAIEQLSMEGRMSLCNMSIEAGAKAGMVAADAITANYLAARGVSSDWSNWRSDADAKFDREVVIDAATIEPMVTWGTNPAMSVAITETLPPPSNPDEQAAYEYMALQPGQSLVKQPVQVAFIGSCTNSRIEDLRIAAAVMNGQTVKVTTLVVPGSYAVKQQAEDEGLDKIFLQAGCEWREPGCSMCIAMNGDVVKAGQYCASTSNRNFVGRQGKGARTFLMSPRMVATAAIHGSIQAIND